MDASPISASVDITQGRGGPYVAFAEHANFHASKSILGGQ